MRWHQIQQVWDRIDEQVRARWDRLSQADVRAIDGDRDSLLGTLCERYEMPLDTADWQVSIWQNGYTDHWLYGGSSDRNSARG